MEKHSAAERYHERGWRVLALHKVYPDGECSCARAQACRSKGKHPLDLEWQEAEPLSSADRIAHFLEEDRNVGIATGSSSGIWVLDVDPDHGGDTSLQRLIEEHGPLPATYTVRTGSGGAHYYYLLPDFELRNTKGKLGEGLDTRGEGGQVVAPPSVTDKGTYAVSLKRDPVPAPEWLLELLRPAEVVVSEDVAPPRNPDGWLRSLLAGKKAELEELATSDGWDDGTFRVAVRLAEVAKSEWNPLELGYARAFLHEHAPLQPKPTTDYPYPWTSEDVERKWQSALRKAEPIPPPAARPESRIDFDPEAELLPLRTLDDAGNGRRLADRYGHRLRYVRTDKAWAVYTAGRWVRRNDLLAGALVLELMEELEDREAERYSDVPDEGGKSDRTRFRAWARKQGSERTMSAALNAAKRLPELQAEVGAFDNRPFLLNGPNGVLDLETGERLEHSPAFMLTTQLAAPIDLGAEAPRWTAFLERVIPDPEVRSFLARAVGYSLTGSMAEQVMFMHHGEGANGKSVFLDVIGSLLGDYGQVVPRQTLLVKRNDGIPTDIARMVGKRFLQTNETATGRHLDEEVVKSITGGDRQVARHLHGDEFEFRPQGKLHYVTNHLPNLTDAESIWRRIVLVRWGVVIPEGERDGHLAETIVRTEAAGVLAWAIRGCLDWRTRGLEVPLSCRMDRDAYREEQDTLGEFLREELVSAPGRWTPIGEAYRVYASWALANGHRPMASQTLAKRLKERGYELDRKYDQDLGKQARVVFGVIPRELARVEFPGSDI